jgi:hypothetical protein
VQFGHTLCGSKVDGAEDSGSFSAFAAIFVRPSLSAFEPIVCHLEAGEDEEKSRMEVGFRTA